MAYTIYLIKKIYDIDINVDEIPLDDKETYEMLARGETTATFQLNGSGMTRFLKELQPTNINDINAMVALYRPGPMAFIPDYIERKHNPKKVKYLDERFQEILEATFGILIYQDDIMMIAVNFAGYSWGEADKFRKAMGKKIPEVMQEQKEKFCKGCIKVGGLTERQVKDLWESIETFAAYGFNKAHAASYGRVAYLTSYLKAHYPVLYMAAVLTADSGDVEKIAEMVSETKRMGIKVLPPDINESFRVFSVDKEKALSGVKEIRFGLGSIKNFGEGIAGSIISERKKNGKFKSLEDFLNRVIDRNLNKKSMEALIKSGALDSFGERGQMLSNLEEILSYSKEIGKKSVDQGSLFSGAEIDQPALRLRKAPNISEEDRLSWEKELLGLYVSGHPLDKFKEKLKKGLPIKEVKAKIHPGMTVVLAGHIDIIRDIITKGGKKMAFVSMHDLTDKIEVVVFPKIYEEQKDILEEGKYIMDKGKLSERNGELGVIDDKIKEL